MPKLIVFNQVTVDGYFAGVNGNISWAHNNKEDTEWQAFVQGNASGSGVLVFGRVTYEMMANYWPTPQAMVNNPTVAQGMNDLQKVVFSRTLNQASWKNTKVVKDDLLAAVRKMKDEPGDDLVILGSGSLVSQLSQARLVDEYQIVVLPVILGKGRTLFEGMLDPLAVNLTKTRAFSNGNVLLCYQPAT